MVSKNKIEEMENLLYKKDQTKNKLFNIMDPLKLGIEEMRKSFSSIFATSNGGKNKITLSMEKFEKRWNKLKFK